MPSENNSITPNNNTQNDFQNTIVTTPTSKIEANKLETEG